jgi:3-hydroxybutyryl-CoA dehydratase
MTAGKLTRVPSLYFEEFAIGDNITSVGRTITEADVVNFAALSGDWNLIHTNAVFSDGHMFGQRVAHGMLVLSIATGLAVRLGFMDDTILAFRNIGEWRFQSPVFIGDTVQVRLSVEETKAMPRVGGGLITFKVEVFNQRNEVVQRGTWGMLIKAMGQETRKDASS